MGKLKKEVVDEIRRLGEEGYTTAEIADSVGVHRDTVRKYRIGGDSAVVLDGAKWLGLSDGITRRLYDLQGILGTSSIADAVERAYRDEVSAAKFKTTLWGEYSIGDEKFTVAAFIEKVLEYVRDLEEERDFGQEMVGKGLETIANLKEQVQSSYDEGYKAGKSDHAVYLPCAYCGRPWQIKPLSDAHRAITEMMIENGWGHGVCADRFEDERGAGSRRLNVELKRLF